MKQREHIEYFTNLVFYHLFRFEKWTQHLISDPLIRLIRLPVIAKFQKKRDIEEVVKDIDKTLYDRKNGVNIMFADTHLTFLFYLISSGTANFLINLLSININQLINKDLQYLIYFVVTYIPAWVAVEMLTSRKNKYLKYFKKFEKKSYEWQHNTEVLTFFTAVGIWVYGIGGFIFYLTGL